MDVETLPAKQRWACCAEKESRGELRARVASSDPRHILFHLIVTRLLRPSALPFDACRLSRAGCCKRWSAREAAARSPHVAAAAASLALPAAAAPLRCACLQRCALCSAAVLNRFTSHPQIASTAWLLHPAAFSMMLRWRSGAQLRHRGMALSHDYALGRAQALGQRWTVLYLKDGGFRGDCRPGQTQQPKLVRIRRRRHAKLLCAVVADPCATTTCCFARRRRFMRRLCRGAATGAATRRRRAAARAAAGRLSARQRIRGMRAAAGLVARSGTKRPHADRDTRHGGRYAGHLRRTR